jgi:hypothetical protein
METTPGDLPVDPVAYLKSLQEEALSSSSRSVPPTVSPAAELNHSDKSGNLETFSGELPLDPVAYLKSLQEEALGTSSRSVAAGVSPSVEATHNSLAPASSHFTDSLHVEDVARPAIEALAGSGVLSAAAGGEVLESIPGDAAATVLTFTDHPAAQTGLGLSLPSSLLAPSLLPSQVENLAQGTVSPADITRSIDVGVIMPSPLHQTSLTGGFDLDDHTATGDTTTTSSGVDRQGATDSIVAPAGPVNVKFTITLPFASNAREQYDSIVMDNKKVIEDVTRYFGTSDWEDAAKALVLPMESMFAKLYDWCDYPPFLHGLPLEDMTSSERKHHAVSTNPKFSFILEFLESLRDSDLTILIVVRTTKLQGFMLDVLKSEGFKHKLNAWDSYALGKYPLAVELVLADENYSGSLQGCNVVIGFDHAFRSSHVAKNLSMLEDRQPSMVLHLVVTCSIEQIDLETPFTDSEINRYAAISSSLYHAREFIRNPPRGYPEPWRLAHDFAQQLKEPREDFMYYPQDLPEEVIDIYETQSRTQQFGAEEEEPGTRKRKMVSQSQFDSS